jgi:RimJ/RimL family protein N-acetyltransferase
MTTPDPNPDPDIRYRQPILLRDGRPAQIRALRPDDIGRLERAFAQLDRETIYTRYFSHRKGLMEADRATIAQVDFVHRADLLVTVGEGDDEVVIGSGLYVIDPRADPPSAEVAFIVAEDYQGQGLASALLAALVGIARRHGLRRFTAEVLAHNAPMLAVFKRCGLPMTSRSESGIVRLDFELPPTPARGA